MHSTGWEDCECDRFYYPAKCSAVHRVWRVDSIFCVDYGCCYATVSWLKIIPRVTTQRLTTFWWRLGVLAGISVLGHSLSQGGSRRSQSRSRPKLQKLENRRKDPLHMRNWGLTGKRASVGCVLAAGGCWPRRLTLSKKYIYIYKKRKKRRGKRSHSRYGPRRWIIINFKGTSFLRFVSVMNSSTA